MIDKIALEATPTLYINLMAAILLKDKIHVLECIKSFKSRS